MARKNDLTDHQIKVLDLVESGMSFEDLATTLDVVDGYRAFKDAIRDVPKETVLKRYPMIFLKYEQAEQSEELDKISTEGKAAGIPGKILNGVRKRVTARTMPVVPNNQILSDKELIAVMQQSLSRAIAYLDDFALAGASVKDLASVIDTLVSNIQLLRGLPTSIMSVEDRRTLNELIPAVVQEAKRRGLSIEDAQLTKGS